MCSIRHLVNPIKYKQAKEMRRNPTPAEYKLWHEIRGKKIGVRFGRQRVVRGYIVDFYCPSMKLIVEVDGNIHLQKEQKERDKFRETILNSIGFRVLRISNDMVLNHISLALDQIRRAIDEARHA